jgi:predicted Zn-dependent peptidase
VKKDMSDTNTEVLPDWTPPKSDPPVTYVRNTSLNNGDTVQLKLIWRLPVTVYDDAKYPLALILQVLSNGLGSRLVLRLRSELGLIYALDGLMHLDPTDPDLSYLELVTSCRADGVDKIIENVIKEVERLRHQLIPLKDYQVIINQIQMELLDQKFDTQPSKYAEQYSQGLLWDQPSKTFRQVYQKYMDVDRPLIQQTAIKYLDPAKMLTFYSSAHKLPLK